MAGVCVLGNHLCYRHCQLPWLALNAEGKDLLSIYRHGSRGHGRQRTWVGRWSVTIFINHGTNELPVWILFPNCFEVATHCSDCDCSRYVRKINTQQSHRPCHSGFMSGEEFPSGSTDARLDDTQFSQVFQKALMYTACPKPPYKLTLGGQTIIV